MYRVAAACQGGHIVVCGCRLAWYLIYERISKEPDDLFDGLVARFSTCDLRHPENMFFDSCYVGGLDAGCSTSFEILRARVVYRDSRFEIPGPEPRQAREANSVQRSANRPRAKDLVQLVQGVFTVLACWRYRLCVLAYSSFV
jgi:hypothetical protein